VAGRPEDEENRIVNCTVCGAELQATSTDLPFKVTETTIVIIKSVPVMQCVNCPEYLIEDVVLDRIDQILAATGGLAELEVVRYAA
jgi:YgiT-type zinc finger domain-containing protein